MLTEKEHGVTCRLQPRMAHAPVFKHHKTFP